MTMLRELRISVVALVALSVLTGLVYPLAITADQERIPSRVQAASYSRASRITMPSVSSPATTVASWLAGLNPLAVALSV